MAYFYRFFLISLVVPLLFSCKKDVEAEIPSYLTINSITAKDSNNKVMSSNIKDAWVYVNDKFKGIYELPVSLPIIENGPHRVDIRAGIHENGISELKVIYPFYEKYSRLIDLRDEVDYLLQAEVHYIPEAKLNTSWAGADFEGGINFYRSPHSDTIFELTAADPADSVYGISSGTFYLTDEKPFFEAYSENIVSIPRNGSDIWMEMDYKSDAMIVVGLYQEFRQEQFPLVYFKPQQNWTKVYINLNNAVLSRPGSPNYNFFIGAKKDNSLTVSSTSIDNVKLLHF